MAKLTNLLTLSLLCGLLLVAFSPETALAGEKGGDLIIMNSGGGGDGGDGGGGGQPIVVKTGGKKGRNIYLIGRKRRSVDPEETQVPFTVYRIPSNK